MCVTKYEVSCKDFNVIRPKHAFGYIARTNSKDGDSGFLHSVPASFRDQKDMGRQWGAQRGFKIIHWFKDEDPSARLDQRPGFQDLIAKLTKSSTRVIVVHSLAVLSPNMHLQGMLARTMERYGLKLMQTQPAGDHPLRDQGWALVNAFEPLERSLRVGLSKNKGGSSGGRKPYGYRSNEAMVLTIMSSLQSDGRNAREIADVLNDTRIEPRTKGSRWHSFT